MSVILSAHLLTKSFGNRSLFKDITFAIEDGQKIGLIGPNGAGKSSLMRLLSKLDEPDSGQISSARGLRIGFLPQSPVFSAHETVMEALMAGAPEFNTQKAEEWISRISQYEEGVSPDDLVANLSGGWRKKVALGREWLREPDLLLLDEPTNHLDFESIEWLEEFLATPSKMAILTITHDRLFLQNVASQIFDLDAKYKNGLLKIEGSYSDYLYSRDIILSGQKTQELARANDLRRETAWLRRGAKARQTKQKARIEKAHALADEVQDLRNRNQDTNIELEIGAAGRSPKKLIEAKKISKSYAGKTLFKDFDVIITPRTRIGLIGRNGCGKSTLIKTLIGELTPDNGTVFKSDQLSVSYFQQHREALDPKETLQKTLCPDGDYVHFQGKPIFVKSYLDRFRFDRNQHNMPVEKLSGGEQSRLLIAKLMLTSANVLILDEPTNDLDIATLDVLRDALNQFPGAVILVTHDRFFMEQVCDHLIAFPSLSGPKVPSGELQKFSSYLQWQNWRETATNESKEKEKISTKREEKRKLSYKEQIEFNGMESTILAKEAQMTDLQSQMVDSTNASNSLLLTDLSKQISILQSEIDKLYERWSELGEKS